MCGARKKRCTFERLFRLPFLMYPPIRPLLRAFESDAFIIGGARMRRRPHNQTTLFHFYLVLCFHFGLTQAVFNADLAEHNIRQHLVQRIYRISIVFVIVNL